jgi:hypothetical protein
MHGRSVGRASESPCMHALTTAPPPLPPPPGSRARREDWEMQSRPGRAPLGRPHNGLGRSLGWRGHPLGSARDGCLPPPCPPCHPPPPGVGTLSVPRETRCALACKCSSRRLRFSPQVPGETLASRAALSIHSAIGAALLSAASLRAGSDLAAALALDTALGLEGPQGRAPTTAPSWMTPRRPSRRPVRIESVLDQTVNT